LNLGDKNGIRSIQEISQKYKDLPILILSMFPEEPYALQSIQAGASAYLNKKMLSTELIHALNSILLNKIYLSKHYIPTLPNGIKIQKSSIPSDKKLSQREFEVYSMIAEGYTYQDIAKNLEISPKTVSTYRSRILIKMSLTTTAQLLHFAMQDILGEKKSNL
jgi:DNA-binding NarL/FixJ family response regulator